MTWFAAHGGLFLAAFLAATVLPAKSELALAALLRSGTWPVWSLLAAASLGNVLGALANYALGRLAGRLAGRRWFPLSPSALNRAAARYRRHGRWSLLLSWVPVIGDPLTLAAGLLREPVWSFLLLVTIAKAGRYIVVAALVRGWV